MTYSLAIFEKSQTNAVDSQTFTSNRKRMIIELASLESQSNRLSRFLYDNFPLQDGSVLKTIVRNFLWGFLRHCQVAEALLISK